MRFWTVFVRNDLRNISRDSLLLYVLTLPWLIPVIFRLGIPPLARWLERDLQFVLQPYLPLILSFSILLQVPLIFGVVFGFLLLDEKDEGVLAAVQVTPLSLNGYLRHRLLLVGLLALVYVVLMLPATGLVSWVLLFRLLPLVLLASILGIWSTLFIPVVANNKVEGFALMKAMGLLMLGPLTAFFVQGPWQLLLGIVPSYWLAKSYWLISDGQQAWLYILAGAAYLKLLVFLFFRRFRRKYTL